MAGAWSVVYEAFVWIACTAGFLYQASDVLQLYTRHAFTVTVYKEHGSRHIRFPAATICTEKWSKRDVLCGNNNSLCQSSSEALAERLLFDPELRKEAAYTPSELFNCRMRSQDDKIRRTFYRTPFLMCYTFDLYQYSETSHQFRSCEVPWLYEVELTAAWDALNTGPTDNVWKYPLIVHEPEVCPPEKLAPIHLRQGMRYTVSVAQRTFRRLPYPSSSRCTDYRQRGRVGAYFGYMNYAVCLQDCLIQQELKTCGCVFPDHEFAATSFNGAICSSEKKTRLRTTSSSLALQIMRSSFTAIIRFATNLQTVYDYQRRLTGQEALAYIGGYIGLWLGVSLYSVYVVLETSLTKFLRSRFHVFKHLVRA
ncbi:uncharacterized protein LOC119456926 [Dermacentor silvarum]|uniref:uncharacterized protein LOC119456926 n=1 Tax=Dermacentor silvarum TaxID=543639 RepID=UPI00210140B1|nr:uncharacterized protein LOC119456926 [Dermacentor silvarum]